MRGRFKVAVNCESLVNSDSAFVGTAIFKLVKQNEKCFFSCAVDPHLTNFGSYHIAEQKRLVGIHSGNRDASYIYIHLRVEILRSYRHLPTVKRVVQGSLLRGSRTKK